MAETFWESLKKFFGFPVPEKPYAPVAGENNLVRTGNSRDEVLFHNAARGAAGDTIFSYNADILPDSRDRIGIRSTVPEQRLTGDRYYGPTNPPVHVYSKRDTLNGSYALLDATRDGQALGRTILDVSPTSIVAEHTNLKTGKVGVVSIDQSGQVTEDPNSDMSAVGPAKLAAERMRRAVVSPTAAQ